METDGTVEVEEWTEAVCEWTPLGTFAGPLREFHNSNVYLGSTLIFDIPDGVYGDGSLKIRRWTMESVQASRLVGDFNQYSGFVFVQIFDDDQIPEFDGYRKQRWTLVRQRHTLEEAAT